MWGLIWSGHGYLVYHKEEQRVETLKAEAARLRQQKGQLAREVLHLRHDPGVIEKYVHQELGYVHPDEFMVIMPKASDDGSEGNMSEKKAPSLKKKHADTPVRPLHSLR